MELGWIIIMTPKLTRANLLRIKETVIHLVTTNPHLSAIVFVVVAAVISVFIIKYIKSA